MKKGKVINTLLVCSWVFFFSLLIHRHYAGVELEQSASIDESFKKTQEWYYLYMGAQEVGSAMTSVEKAGREMIMNHKLAMTVTKNGKKVVHHEIIRCLTDQSFALTSFEYESDFDKKERLKASGKLDGETLLFFLESETKRKTYQISTGGRDVYLPISFIRAVHSKNPVPNTEYLVQILNIATLKIEEAAVMLEEVRPFKLGSGISNLYRYRSGQALYWVSDSGAVVKQEHPSGITLYARTGDTSEEDRGGILLDYTSLPFIQSDVIILDSSNISLLKLRLEGFNPEPHLYADSLTMLEGDILTVRRLTKEDVVGMTYTLPVTEEKLKKYLSEDEWVLSGYQPLRDTGVIYARAQKNDAYSFSKYLNGYVHNLIRTRPRFFISDAKGILESSLRGDYIARTVMFATYARAAGLPTRLIGGLLYVNGYFYFHTWLEAWFGRWVPVDPTFFQFPADALHIPLKEGTVRDILRIVEGLKNVRIHVLEAS